MTREEIKQAVRADILARKAPFTFAEAADDAEDKYGRGERRPGGWRTTTDLIVDAQIQSLRRKGLIRTERRGRVQLWSVVEELKP